MTEGVPVFFALSDTDGLWVSFPFYRNGRPYTVDCSDVPVPRCGLSLRRAGSMRLRWAEPNPRRDIFFGEAGFDPSSVVAVQLSHSRTVLTADTPSDTEGKEGDGVLVRADNLVPSVTAADCLPVYLHDPVTGCFGVVHSGWKGTGIVLDALRAAASRWGAEPRNFLAVLGPHINDCCYTVDKQRAEYFRTAFAPDCVRLSGPGMTAGRFPFRLSLARANIVLLEEAGVRDIAVCTDCTSCSPFLGSFRRETADGSSGFTCMAAFAFIPKK